MPTPQPHLLAVGITAYAPDSGLAQTPYAEEDATEIAAEFAARCGFQTTALLGKDATLQNIQRAILAISRNSGPLFAFGFFGHGQHIHGHYMLHPYDSTLDGLGGLSFELLSRQWQSNFGFEQVIAILDACRNELGSDSLSRGNAPAHSEQASRDLEQVVNNGARRIEILYGCRQGQRCWGYHELKHGLLSAAILDILRTHPKDQDLDFRSLADKAADWMEDSDIRKFYGESRRQSAHLYGQPTLKRRILLYRAAQTRERLLEEKYQKLHARMVAELNAMAMDSARLTANEILELRPNDPAAVEAIDYIARTLEAQERRQRQLREAEAARQREAEAKNHAARTLDAEYDELKKQFQSEIAAGNLVAALAITQLLAKRRPQDPDALRNADFVRGQLEAEAKKNLYAQLRTRLTSEIRAQTYEIALATVNEMLAQRPKDAEAIKVRSAIHKRLGKAPVPSEPPALPEELSTKALANTLLPQPLPVASSEPAPKIFPLWVRVVLTLYLFLFVVVSFLLPIGYIRGDSLQSVWVGVAVAIFGFLLPGASLFVIPVKATRRRPIRRRSIAYPIVGSAVFIALLFFFAFAAMGDAPGNTTLGNALSYIALWGAIPVWLIWIISLSILCRSRDVLSMSNRIYQYLVVGTVIELLIAVPSHLIARRRPECCAGVISGIAIATGSIIAIILIGPGIYFLFRRRWMQYYSKTQTEEPAAPKVAKEPKRSAAKRWISILCIVATSLLIYGGYHLFSGKSPGPKRDRSSLRYALVPKGNNVYYEPARNGFFDAGNRLGVKTEFDPPAEFTIAAQKEVMERLIAEKVDGIAVSTLDDPGLKTVVQRARDAGIKVVAFQAEAPNAGSLAFVGTDNENAGYRAGLEFVEQFGTTGDILVLSDGFDSPVLIARFDGFKKALREKAPSLRIVAWESNCTSRSTAQSKIEADLTTYPNVTSLFGLGYEQVPYAAELMKENKSFKLNLAGFDDDTESLAAVADGTCRFLVVQRPYAMGWLAFQSLQAAIDGNPVTRNVDSSVKIVKKENVKTYQQEIQDEIQPH